MNPAPDWSDLKLLLAVTEAGSASAAARALGVDKATVSRRITALERDLGLRLMVRRAAGWRPTPAGERVAGAARVMAGQVKGLLGDLVGRHGAPRSTVSITAPSWFCRRLLLPGIPALLARAPWLDVAIAASSRVLNLAQREADVAVRNRRPAEGDAVVRKAGELGSALYGARAYLKKRNAPIAGGAVDPRHSLIGYHDRMSYLAEFQWLDAASGSAAAVLRADDADALFALVAAGTGLGVLPCVIGDADPSLERVSAVARESIWLVSPGELAGTRAVKLALAFVVETFKRHERELAG